MIALTALAALESARDERDRIGGIVAVASRAYETACADFSVAVTAVARARAAYHEAIDAARDAVVPS